VSPALVAGSPTGAAPIGPWHAGPVSEHDAGPPDDLVAALLARCRFAPAAEPVVCAVSGGADSLALLLLAAAGHDDVTAVHVDHGLRAGGDAEAELVHRVADAVGATFRAERVEVGAGPNLEARARAARYAVLPDGACTGHTADDQAETVLLQLLRGAGLEGIAAMRADARRPILGLRRAETRGLCAAAGLTVVEDPTNLDPAWRRNRVRHEVLPLLDDVAGRDVVPLLTRLAEHARGAADHLAGEAAAIDPTDARALRAAPDALARVSIRSWLRTCSPERHPPDTAAVERVLAVARGEAVATDVGRGWRVARTAGRLRLEPPAGGTG
jgi:tRNA(Ile)-lysidine synthase